MAVKSNLRLWPRHLQRQGWALDASLCCPVIPAPAKRRWFRHCALPSMKRMDFSWRGNSTSTSRGYPCSLCGRSCSSLPARCVRRTLLSSNNGGFKSGTPWVTWDGSSQTWPQSGSFSWGRSRQSPRLAPLRRLTDSHPCYGNSCPYFAVLNTLSCYSLMTGNGPTQPH
ncbi:hypothetical protein SDC9_158288 [bioreactor metagenome]|uniref:Uncharacterized protein n=1 Tax=bioreactor metagenome TaxID=1076179 RepID=A0A645FAQ4_9ZZZZ